MSNKIAKRDIEQFTQLVKDGMNAWIQAGLLYVKMLDKNPDVADIIIEKAPFISRSILRRFEEIGRKQLHPRLLVMDGAGPRKLRSMPYSEQEKYVQQPIEMLVVKGTGKTDKMLVDVQKLSNECAKQVFAPDHVRDLAEQRAYIEAVKAVKVQEEEIEAQEEYSTPWEVRRGKVFICKPCSMTKQELVAILGTMV